ncbi:helix-turn-helix transcriptional regulator [Haloferula sargassicola]|uniref:HTH araC/xylS-type domain-containing protein n=1 Tax=Haloferula sargassicola TaxID=490096 RepID=A0ABP9UMD2_9BACT
MRIVRHGNRLKILGFGCEVHGCLASLALEEGYRVAAVSERIRVCEGYLREMFLRDLGVTPKRWMREERLGVARKRLDQGADLREVAAELGFATPGNLTREFRTLVGMTPSAYLSRRIAKEPDEPGGSLTG